MKNSKKVIQIGGTVRSGTTLLGLIMANHPSGMALGEVLHIFSPYTEKHRKVIADLKQDDRWRKILEDQPENLYKNIFKLFPEIDVITDSSKDPFWFKKLEKESTSINLQRIITYKTPEGLYNSFKKRNMSNWHKVYLNCYRRWFSLFPNSRSVMINDILNNEEILRKLCATYNLEFFPSRINYWEKEQPNFFGSQTVKKNKIEIENSKVEQKLEVSNDLKRIYDVLETINIKNEHFKPSTAKINDLKYNNVSLRLLKIKDDLVFGKPLKNILKENFRIGY